MQESSVTLGFFFIYHTYIIPNPRISRFCTFCNLGSKIYGENDPKFLHGLKGMVTYFLGRDFGVRYMHPKGTFVGFLFWA